MKINQMYLLPIILVSVLGLYLGLKWWNSQTANMPQPALTDGLSVDERGESLLKQFGLNKDRSAQLKGAGEGYGVVRWSEDKKAMTTVADLPVLTTGMYQVWLKDAQDIFTKLGTMRYSKGGYVLDYSFKMSLPSTFSVVVSKEVKNDGVLEEKVLDGDVKTE